MKIKHIVAMALAVVAAIGSQELFARGGGGGGGHGGGGGFGGGGRGGFGGGRSFSSGGRSFSSGGRSFSSTRGGMTTRSVSGSRVGTRGTTMRGATTRGTKSLAGTRAAAATRSGTFSRFGSGRQFGSRGWHNWGRFGYWGWGAFGWGWWLGWGPYFWPWSPWWIYDDECCGITIVEEAIPDTIYIETPEDDEGWAQLEEQLAASQKDLKELDRRIAKLETKIQRDEDDEVATKVDKQQLRTLRDTRKKVKTYVNKLQEAQQEEA